MSYQGTSVDFLHATTHQSFFNRSSKYSSVTVNLNLKAGFPDTRDFFACEVISFVLIRLPFRFPRSPAAIEIGLETFFCDSLKTMVS